MHCKQIKDVIGLQPMKTEPAIMHLDTSIEQARFCWVIAGTGTSTFTLKLKVFYSWFSANSSHFYSEPPPLECGHFWKPFNTRILNMWIFLETLIPFMWRVLFIILCPRYWTFKRWISELPTSGLATWWAILRWAILSPLSHQDCPPQLYHYFQSNCLI